MRLNETTEKFFTYKQTANILESEGFGYTLANVSFHVRKSKQLTCVEYLGEPRMITRESLELMIKARGVK